MEFSAATVWRRAAEPGPMMMAEEEAQQHREPASRSRRLHKRMESLGREKECVGRHSRVFQLLRPLCILSGWMFRTHKRCWWCEVRFFAALPASQPSDMSKEREREENYNIWDNSTITMILKCVINYLSPLSRSCCISCTHIARFWMGWFFNLLVFMAKLLTQLSRRIPSNSISSHDCCWNCARLASHIIRKSNDYSQVLWRR